MKRLEIEAVVKVNYGEGWVLNRPPEFKYEKKGRFLIATDWCLSGVYYYESPSTGFKAFGGAKFDIPMVDGTVTKAYGQYWMGHKMGNSSVIYQTKERLIQCYVFAVCQGNPEGLREMRGRYTGHVFDYQAYEALIQAKGLRVRNYDKVRKLERANTSLVKEVKRLARECRGK